MTLTPSHHWRDTTFPSSTGMLQCSIQANRDGTLWRADSPQSTSWMSLTVEAAALMFHASRCDGEYLLDMEDTVGVADGHTHDFVMTFGRFGSRFYLDGYQCFSSATNFCPVHIDTVGSLTLTDDNGLSATNAEFASLASPEQIAMSAPVPVPDIEFAASHLATPDIAVAKTLTTGTLYVHFRVRGPHQGGTILAASSPTGEELSLSIDDAGLTYRIRRHGQWQTVHTPGTWDDGEWHDLIVRAARGAIDIYVNGHHKKRAPGQAFFGHIEELENIHVGEDSHGVRLMGEVRNGGIFTRSLSEGEVKRLSHAQPLVTTALFDRGFAGSNSYRIPSLVTSPRGTVIAGADQRVFISNDAPNKINFVIRRSLDDGKTWLPMQTVLSYPGNGVDGACATDSCFVTDRTSGRIIVLIDHFPGATGLPNNEPGTGMTAGGDLLLYDNDGGAYVLRNDGHVLKDGETTAYTVDENGQVSVKGEPGGNIHLALGQDPFETLHTARTSYIVSIYSDDEGESWSQPTIINHMVKESWMRFMGVSPGNGIQLSIKYPERLLIPYYFTGESSTHYSSGALISDDCGETWRRGNPINDGRLINGKVVNPRFTDDDDATSSETVFVERTNGDVVAFFRNQNREGRVGKAVSHDGGETWDELEFDPQLPEIFSQPNAITLPPKSQREPGQVWNCASDLVIFANASQMMPYRGRGVLRLSVDGGKTWVADKCFNPHHYVYQCMSVLPDSDIGLLWERECAGVYFTRLARSWLTDKR